MKKYIKNNTRDIIAIIMMVTALSLGVSFFILIFLESIWCVYILILTFVYIYLLMDNIDDIVGWCDKHEEYLEIMKTMNRNGANT